jgi:ribose transport system permease protein
VNRRPATGNVVRAAVDVEAAPAPDASLPLRDRLQALNRTLGVWAALAILVVVSWALEPTLLSESNVTLLLRQASILGLLAVGQTVVMLTGGIDLSVGSVVAVVNWVSTTLLAGSDSRNGPVLALCLGIGATVGLINGVGVAKLRVPPFVMTLGMLFAVQAAGFMYTDGITRGQASDFLITLGQGFSGPLPIAFLIFVAVAGATYLLLKITPYGRRVYAIGANPRAAHMAGIAVDRVLILSYALCGVTAAMGGLLLSGYIEIGDNTSGRGLELEAIAAVVIGGTTLAGGRGSVVGTVGGVLLLGLLFNLLIVLDIAQSGRLMLQGAVIVIAAAIYSRALRR